MTNDYPLTFSLAYKGEEGAPRELDLYDFSIALIGFQRSLALTTHLVLTGKIIAQSTSLRGADIITFPPEDGSWKTTAAVITENNDSGTAPSDTTVGHLIRSAYEYVVNKTLGFDPDFEKTLGRQYDELKRRGTQGLSVLKESDLVSLMGKCEVAIRDMHRPIYYSKTAVSGLVTSRVSGVDEPFANPLTFETYWHGIRVVPSKKRVMVVGRVSSYNTKTYNGKIYDPESDRLSSFGLEKSARKFGSTSLIIRSLAEQNKRFFKRKTSDGLVACEAFKRISVAGQIKGYDIIDVKKFP